MQQKTVFTEISEVDIDREGSVLFPQNQLLYVDQMTDYGPELNEDRVVFSPKKLQDVFDHYRPSKKGLSLYDEDGNLQYEDFDFCQIEDFDDENLIKQSKTMTHSQDLTEAYRNASFQIGRNRDLRSLLSDPDMKVVLLETLKKLRSELK